MVPKDRNATTSLGHLLLPHSSGAEWFPPIPSEVPVLQKCLLALVLSRFGSAFSVYISRSERCVCGPISHLSSGLKKPGYLSLSFYTMCSTLSPTRWPLLGCSLSPFLLYQEPRLDTVLHAQPQQCPAVGNTALTMI